MPTENPDPIYVAIETYFCIDPATNAPHTIQQGSRYRLSSGFPARHPTAWVPDGASTSEIGRAKVALVATDDDAVA